MNEWMWLSQIVNNMILVDWNRLNHLKVIENSVILSYFRLTRVDISLTESIWFYRLYPKKLSPIVTRLKNEYSIRVFSAIHIFKIITDTILWKFISCQNGARKFIPHGSSFLRHVDNFKARMYIPWAERTSVRFIRQD